MRKEWMILTAAGSLRAVGVFLLNVVVAVVGTAILESSFEHYAHLSTTRESLFFTDLLTSTFAFGVGFSVYWRWRPTASKGVWIAGICLLRHLLDLFRLGPVRAFQGRLADWLAATSDPKVAPVMRPDDPSK